MSWLALRLFAGRILAFLGKLNIWQLACIALALFSGLQTLRLASEKRHSHKVEVQLQKATEQLQSISSRKNEQKQRTEENIKVVTRIVHDADERAKRVEQAPPAKDCKTKPEVLQADL